MRIARAPWAVGRTAVCLYGLWGCGSWSHQRPLLHSDPPIAPDVIPRGYNQNMTYAWANMVVVLRCKVSILIFMIFFILHSISTCSDLARNCSITVLMVINNVLHIGGWDYCTFLSERTIRFQTFSFWALLSHNNDKYLRINSMSIWSSIIQYNCTAQVSGFNSCAFFHKRTSLIV